MANLFSKYYISTGEQTKLFTLRHMFDEVAYFRGEGGAPCSAIVRRDHHVRNLANDADRAIEKAAELGHKLTAPKFTLEEIKRRSSEEVEAARIKEEEHFNSTQKMKLDEELQLVKDHCFPFGRNKGYSLEKLIEQKGDTWAGYWMKEGRAENTSATVTLLGAVLESLYPEIVRVTFLKDSGNGQFFGKVGVRQKLIKAMSVASYGFDSQFGYTYIEKFLTETGELLMYMGSACINIEKGQSVIMSFGIKEHEVFKNEHQTKIQRVKINS